MTRIGPGSSMVASTTAKSLSRPRKRSRAKGKAISEQERTEPTMARPLMKALLAA
jgi:hypothetical protein